MATAKPDIFNLMRDKISDKVQKKASEPVDFEKDPVAEFHRRSEHLKKTGSEMSVRDVVCAAMAYTKLRKETENAE